MFKLLLAYNESAKSLFDEADTEKAFIPRVSDPNFSVSDFLNKMKDSQGYKLFVSQTEMGENCGFISLLPNKDKDSFSIGPMYIKKEYRGKSIGKFQVEKVIDWARSNGIKKLHTETWGQNNGSRKIFEDLGFKLTSDKMNDRINGDSTVGYDVTISTSEITTPKL